MKRLRLGYLAALCAFLVGCGPTQNGAVLPKQANNTAPPQGGTVATPSDATAPNPNGDANATPAGYAVREVGTDTASADSGPVRMARISYIKGQVAWRPSTSVDWSTATLNMPLRQGSEVWAKPGSRAELQFDDGSYLRLGGGAMATLSSMYSDNKGEFTEVSLNGGLASAHLKTKLSEYQFDTPKSSIKSTGPADLRLGVGNTVEVACRKGSAQVSNHHGSITLRAAQRVDVDDPDADYTVTEVPPEDSWDQFTDQREVAIDYHNQYVPPNIDLVAGDLDTYGTWHSDPTYGEVWAPRVVAADWRPYRDGHWAWVSPFGWTWVSNEDWGYAPYHYGTWVHASYGWGWVPGPARQYWSPAVVHFTDYNDDVAWAPLAPAEVHYPASLSIGFASGDWAFSFSIGQAGCYYPYSSSYCVGQPWDNRYVNRTNIYNVTNITNIYNGNAVYANNIYRSGGGFVPRNAVFASGVTSVSRNGFLGGGNFRSLRGSQAALFRNGRSFVAPPTRGSRFAGPFGVRPTAASFTPTRRFDPSVRPPASVLNRTTFRAGVPAAIARHGAVFAGQTVLASSRPARSNVMTNVDRSGFRSAMSNRRSATAPTPGLRPGQPAFPGSRNIPPRTVAPSRPNPGRTVAPNRPTAPNRAFPGRRTPPPVTRHNPAPTARPVPHRPATNPRPTARPPRRTTVRPTPRRIPPTTRHTPVMRPPLRRNPPIARPPLRRPPVMRPPVRRPPVMRPPVRRPPPVFNRPQPRQAPRRPVMRPPTNRAPQRQPQQRRQPVRRPPTRRPPPNQRGHGG